MNTATISVHLCYGDTPAELAAARELRDRLITATDVDVVVQVQVTGALAPYSPRPED